MGPSSIASLCCIRATSSQLIRRKWRTDCSFASSKVKDHVLCVHHSAITNLFSRQLRYFLEPIGHIAKFAHLAGHMGCKKVAAVELVTAVIDVLHNEVRQLVKTFKRVITRPRSIAWRSVRISKWKNAMPKKEGKEEMNNWRNGTWKQEVHKKQKGWRGKIENKKMKYRKNCRRYAQSYINDGQWAVDKSFYNFNSMS